MTPKLTDEQRMALQANPGKPLRVEDEQTQQVYLIMSEQALPTMWEEYIRREVEKGLDAVDQGDAEDRDIESIKAIQRGLADVDTGRTRPYQDVLASLDDGDAE